MVWVCVKVEVKRPMLTLDRGVEAGRGLYDQHLWLVLGEEMESVLRSI